jgi:hypothetical protein
MARTDCYAHRSNRLLDASTEALKQKPPLSGSTDTSEGSSLRPTLFGLSEMQYLPFDLEARLK